MEQSIEKLSELARNLNNVLNYMLKYELDRDIVLDEFKKQKQNHYNALLKNSLTEINQIGNKINNKVKQYHELVRVSELINGLVNTQGKYNQSELLKAVEELQKALPKVQKATLDFEIKNVPAVIKVEVLTDLAEAKKCFDNGCFRSCTILCGRILETCLHRKYYELTKKDILETSPGVGLGKLIAKLKELDVGFDPGITEQIHLINKIRIDSVHKKKVTFCPSRSQAHAMLLYSVDVINKLF